MSMGGDILQVYALLDWGELEMYHVPGLLIGFWR